MIMNDAGNSIGDEFIAGELKYKVLTQNGNTGTVVLICGTDYYDEWDDCEIVIIIPDFVEYESVSYNVIKIGEGAFAYYGGLAGVIIPDSVISIEKEAFYCCEDLKSVTIGKGVTSIEEKAFRGCKSLTDIIIPDNVTYIGGCAFMRCTSLESVTIPDSVPFIGGWTFAGCENLKSITIGKGVTSIGYGAFGGCINLTSILVSVTNSNYSSIDGVLFNKDQTKLIQYPSGKELDTYIIPDCVTSVGDSAFNNCGCLGSVIIHGSVTSIEDRAFSGCFGLTSISVSLSNPKYSSMDGVLFNKDQTKLIQYPAEKKLITYRIPDKVTSIRNSAFVFCEILKDIIIPDSVSFIENNAFARCSSLENITIPDSVTFIGDDAFSNCENLKSVTIGKGVTSIGSEAFGICLSLTSVYYKGDVPSAKNVYKDTPNTLISYYPKENSSWENKIKNGKWQNRRTIAWDPDTEG